MSTVRKGKLVGRVSVHFAWGKAAEILLRFDFPMSNIRKGMGNWSVSKVLAMYERQLENLLYKDRDKPETEILLRLNFQS